MEPKPDHLGLNYAEQFKIDKGKTLPGGDHPHLNWIYGQVEEVKLKPPYALITAGESLHWMEWDICNHSTP